VPPTVGADRSVLPDQTGDDLDVGWGDLFDDHSGDDERFLRERPPHWD
jgi:hypothetical protein